MGNWGKRKIEERNKREVRRKGSREAEGRGFPYCAIGKESACNAGDLRDMGSILGSGRTPEGGHGNPLQYSCLENPVNREPGGLQSIRSQRAGHN